MFLKCTDNPGTCPDYNSVYLKKTAGSDGGGISSCLLGNNDANPFCWDGETCNSWGEHAISGFSSSSTNVCRDNSCAISAPTWNGETCTVRKACSAGVISSSNGIWDNSDMKCASCFGFIEDMIYGDSSGIRIDCSGNPVIGDSQCESACGADALCDEKNIGACTSSTSLQKCTASCAPVTSCGDGAVNCGEACELNQCSSTETMKKCNTACSASVTSCGDWINNCGEAVNTCRSDVCGTSSTRYAFGTIGIGGSSVSKTCGLGTGFTGNNDDWFEVTTSQAGYLSLALEDTPAGCDWDIYVYDTSLNLKFSGTTNACMETKTSPTTLAAGTYLIKVHRVSGNGQGYLRVKLHECLANNAVDANCPPSKQYCSSNKCVECYSNDITYGDANTNNDRSSQCTDPAKPRCRTEPGLGQYTCVAPEPCNTNADCIPGRCCTADLPAPFQLIPGECVALGNTRTPTQPSYLCT